MICAHLTWNHHRSAHLQITAFKQHCNVNMYTFTTKSLVAKIAKKQLATPSLVSIIILPCFLNIEQLPTFTIQLTHSS